MVNQWEWLTRKCVRSYLKGQEGCKDSSMTKSWPKYGCKLMKAKDMEHNAQTASSLTGWGMPFPATSVGLDLFPDGSAGLRISFSSPYSSYMLGKGWISGVRLVSGTCSWKGMDSVNLVGFKDFLKPLFSFWAHQDSSKDGMFHLPYLLDGD